MKSNTSPKSPCRQKVPRSGPHTRSDRRGAILVLAAFVFVFILALVACAVDIGYMAVTKTELQSASDGAALAAAIEVVDGLGMAPIKTQSQMQTASRASAVNVAASNPNGELTGTYLNSSNDVRFGRITWNSTTNSWDKAWGATPANMVEVVAHRDQSGSTLGNKALNLFFAPIMGKNTANLSTRAVAGVLPGSGFRILPGSTVTFGALPIACDETSWNALMAGTGNDLYTYNPTTKLVSGGADGVKELNIYPDPNANLPSGNRGTVDLGNPNNSAADLKRQILYGLNATDLSFFPNNTISTANGPVILNGDTGISAGIKAELEAIKGQPRLMPIFTIVGSYTQASTGVMSGSKATGNNVYYRVIKFVGVRIVFVELTGNNKRVIIQPATFQHSAVIPSKTTILSDSYFAKPRLLE